MTLSDRLFDLPSVHDIIRDATDDLMSGKNVMFVLKDGLPLDLVIGRFYSAIGGRELNFSPVSALTHSPLEAIMEAEQIQLEGKPSAQKLADSGSLPDVILITELEQADESQQQAWFEWLKQWADLAQARHKRGWTTAAHVCILPPDPMLLSLLPTPNTFLHLWRWSDSLSNLEVRLLCHLHPNPEHDEVALRWREYTLPDLASLDVQLVDYLWDDVGLNQCTSAMLVQSLKHYANALRWSEVEVTALPDEKTFARLRRLDIEQNVWRMRGWLYRTTEYGWELHSALLAVRNDENRIAFRYWRGQSKLVLPLLDQIRRHLIDECDAHNRPNWHLGGRPTYWPDDAPFEIYDVEWWWLAYQAPDKDMRGLAVQCRELRNRIAHYKPIMLRDYRDLLLAYEAIKDR